MPYEVAFLFNGVGSPSLEFEVELSLEIDCIVSAYWLFTVGLYHRWSLPGPIFLLLLLKSCH